MPGWLASLLAALLPEPERGDFERRWGGDPARASMAIGAAQFLAGAHLVYESARTFLYAGTAAITDEFWRQANQRSMGSDEILGFTWGGAVLWLGWLLQPTTWLLISIPLVGLLRVAAYLTTSQPVAEPVVWAAVRGASLARRIVGSASERAEFGAATSGEELVRDEAGDLLLLTPRRKPEWTEAATIEIDGRFYRIAEQDTVEAGPGRRQYRYRLVAAGEHDVIRRYLRYDPPAGA